MTIFEYKSVAKLMGLLLAWMVFNQIAGATTPGGFSSTGNLIVARELYTSTVLNNGMVLITGGTGSSGTLASAELYNPNTGLFSLTGSMHFARSGHTATLLNNGMVMIAGGTTSANAELYDPTTGSLRSPVV